MSALWEEILREPAALEFLVLAALFLLSSLLFSRVARSARTVEETREVRDLVKGLDLYIRGEHAAAAPVLARVVERDPDNVEARAALGDCLREVGQPAEAHRHHFQVSKLLGRDTLVSRLAHARDLLALGRASEARAAAERAAEGAPASAEALRLLRECARAEGNVERELFAVRRLLDGRLETTERTRLAAQVPLLETRLAREIQGSDPRAARRLLESAVAKRPTLVGARALLLGGKDGQESSVLSALAPPAGDGGAREHRDGAGTRLVPAPAGEGRGRDALARFLSRLARFRCRECSTPARDLRVLCEACGALGTISEIDGSPLREIPDPAAAIDEIERSPEFVRSAALGAAAGDAGALARLDRALPDSMEGILLAATEAKDPEPLVQRLAGGAGSKVEALVDAFSRARAALASRGALRKAVAPRRPVEPLFAEILSRLEDGDRAIPPLLAHADPAVRTAALEAAIRRGDAATVEICAARAGSAAVRERLRATPGDLLAALLGRIPKDGVLAREVLVDPALSHDRALFDAAAAAAGDVREALVGVLRARAAAKAPGFPRAASATPDAAFSSAEWERIAGAIAPPLLVEWVFDAKTGASQRLAAARALAARGPSAIDPVLDGLDGAGEKGRATAVTILAGMGAAAAQALAARPEIRAAAPGGVGEGVGRLLGGRRLPAEKRRLRREVVAEALARAGGDEAARALARAASATKDDAERRHLEDLARRAGGAAP